MKVWLLRPLHAAGPGPSGRLLAPADWAGEGMPTYLGFVIRAETEASARAHAQRIAADKESAEVLRAPGTAEHPPWKVAAWLDPAKSTCVELKPNGPTGVVMADFEPGGRA